MLQLQYYCGKVELRLQGLLRLCFRIVLFSIACCVGYTGKRSHKAAHLNVEVPSLEANKQPYELLAPLLAVTFGSAPYSTPAVVDFDSVLTLLRRLLPWDSEGSAEWLQHTGRLVRLQTQAACEAGLWKGCQLRPEHLLIFVQCDSSGLQSLLR